MYKMNALLALSVVLLFKLVASNPDGSPDCYINLVTTKRAMGGNGDVDFSIAPSATTYTPGKPIEFALSSKVQKVWTGILIYAEPAGTKDKERLGSWALGTGLKSIDNKCGNIKAPKNSVLTSSNALPRPMDGTKFTWTPEKDYGDVTIRALAVGLGMSAWGVTPDITLKAESSGAIAPKDTTPTQTPQTTGPISTGTSTGSSDTTLSVPQTDSTTTSATNVDSTSTAGSVVPKVAPRQCRPRRNAQSSSYAPTSTTPATSPDSASNQVKSSAETASVSSGYSTLPGAAVVASTMVLSLSLIF